MTSYQVTINRMISTTVDVEADSPEEAAETINRRDYRLPDSEQWDTLPDDEIIIYNARGEILYET